MSVSSEDPRPQDAFAIFTFEDEKMSVDCIHKVNRLRLPGYQRPLKARFCNVQKPQDRMCMLMLIFMFCLCLCL